MSEGTKSVMDTRQGRSQLGQRTGKTPKIENTYALDPKSKFPLIDVRKTVRTLVEERLTNKRYDVENCRQLSQELAQELKKRVVRLNIERYRIITYVVLGQKASSSVAMVSRCLWNDKHDARVEMTFNEADIYATVLVYGVYLE